jgi:hypothetical protein
MWVQEIHDRPCPAPGGSRSSGGLEDRSAREPRDDAELTGALLLLEQQHEHPLRPRGAVGGGVDVLEDLDSD